MGGWQSFLGASQASAVAGNALTTGADLFEGHHSHSLFQCKTLLSHSFSSAFDV